MKTKEDIALDVLRQIILAKDKKKLQRLEKQFKALRSDLDDKESLLDRLDPVFVDLLERKVHSHHDELAETLAPLMGDAIKNQVSDSKEDIIDALYPVMMKTIRKSIAESIKNLVESINQRIDQVLHKKNYTKRIQSKITGIPTGELILKDALPFRIEEIFLIHKKSGLLLRHVSHPQSETTVNKEMISGMLTAIKDFVSESFKTGLNQDLNEIQYGDCKILLEIGRYSYLAVVISGVAPQDFRDDLAKLDRKIYNRFYKKLRHFDGNKNLVADVENPLQQFMAKYNRAISQPEKKKTKPYFILIFLFILVSAVSILFRNLDSNDTIPKNEKQKTIFQNLSNQINEKVILINMQYTVDVVALVEGNTLVLEGKVPTIEIKRDVGFQLSEIQGIRIILNNLMVDQQIENSPVQLSTRLNQLSIRFGLNEMIVPKNQINKLDTVLAIIMKDTSCNLILRGYSDNLSEASYNLELSRKRAQTVADYFVTKGLSKERVILEAYGERNPIASNETEEGRAMNRRVELEIQKSENR